MFTVIRYSLRSSRGAIIGWGIGLAVLAIMMGRRKIRPDHWRLRHYQVAHLSTRPDIVV